MAVAGAKQAQNEEEGSGTDVSVDAVVADKHAESSEKVTIPLKPGQDSMVGFSSVKRITLREGLY